jgi:hypothetical protein
MTLSGWKSLLAGAPGFRGKGNYPIAAYSEFLPPPRLGPKPYGTTGPNPFTADDPWGWHVSEYEETLELRPGLENVARQLLGALSHLGMGRSTHGIARAKLEGNVYWPPELAAAAGRLAHERYVVLLPLALARTQDDKGRVRWTLFGGSEQGPARAFWKSFLTAPRHQVPAEQALDFLRGLLAAVYGESAESLRDLRRAGFRILLDEDEPEPLPAWADGLAWAKGQPIRSVKYVLTFRPFGRLPAAVRQAYLKGRLHLLPFPGSLLFWGAPGSLALRKELPFAVQIPLLQMIGRHEGWRGLRVPQSGWMHEPRPGAETPSGEHGPIRNTYKRTHRWARVLRHEDELAVLQREDKLAHVLFSTMPQDLGLYGKPMARNVQLWTHDAHLLLDGPRAGHDDIELAIEAISRGGEFGYRFLFPAMRVGRHEVYWHRPLVAFLDGEGSVQVLQDAPLGYLTAYDADRPDLARPVEFWPRLLRREPHLTGLQYATQEHHHYPYQVGLNVRKVLDTRQLLGRPLPRSLARSLLTLTKLETLDEWLQALPDEAPDHAAGVRLVEELRGCLEPTDPDRLPEALTFDRTARRSFEVTYWNTIASLAEGGYLNKNNADCVHDPVTSMMLDHHQRDLGPLGDYLIAYYRRVIARAGMTGKALVGDLPFHWRTDFDYFWAGGWINNQEGMDHERDLICVIPGRDRRRAVVMADHYDTAYMVDHFEPEYGGNGARLAAAGADDNHSATAAAMLAAPILLDLSKAGRLACDVWLIHLSGEEFPADCLGARHLTQQLVEGTLTMRVAGGGRRDLSKVRVQGVYVLDMVAHNNDHERDVFQMAPGTTAESMWLAYQAHVANAIWNASVPAWNRRPQRRGRGRGRRSPDGTTMPEVALHPEVRGEVRPAYDPRSTLYNTDGQIFSDAGVPVVLFMENYDINRAGYHDTHDTMENIDLDYGAAVAAIAIEAVARAATEAYPFSDASQERSCPNAPAKRR